MNIFLTGYRGVGKTTVARVLARTTGRDWVDADDEIERVAGAPVADIFAQQGEPAFRDIEAEVVAGLSQRKNCVISLGGGAILRAESRQIIASAGAVVWLQADAGTIHRRINLDTHTPGKRPNLTAQGGLAEIQQLLAERNPLYEEVATLTVCTAGKSALTIAREIAASVSG